jgi:hypothetical protein
MYLYIQRFPLLRGTVVEINSTNLFNVEGKLVYLIAAEIAVICVRITRQLFGLRSNCDLANFDVLLPIKFQQQR